MTTILAKPCHLCGRTLRVLINRQTKKRSVPDVWACEHCDQPCSSSSRCPDCTQAAKALRPGG